MFTRVAAVADISDPGRELVEVEDRLVVLFHVAGQFYAIDDVCTHDDGPLSDGILCGFEIACPRHGAKFDIRNGKALTMPATKPTVAHEVKIENGEVFIQLRDSTTVEASPPKPAAATPAAPVLPLNPVTAPVASVAPAGNVPPAATTPPVAQPVEHTGPLNEDSCREALKQVIDPELFINIVDLGLIYLVQIAEKDEGKSDVTIEMTMTSPACPAGPQLLHNSKEVLKRLPGVDQVEVKLVMAPPWTPDRMTDEARDQLGIF
jgi:metal-sulfur cluster biosynthetic enzyme/nitrite reductase/ring-hydroxylating ferredoxin subunit